MSKAELRAAMLARRRATSEGQRREAARRVREALLAWDGLVGPVFTYVGVGGELGTRALIAALQARGMEVAVPRILGPGRMEAAKLVGPIPEGSRWSPDTAGEVVAPRLVVVPGLAFDARGNRLGQGGGFYDRWLAGHPGVVSVGVCHAFQLVDEVPVDPHDRPVDRVLTDAGWAR